MPPVPVVESFFAVGIRMGIGPWFGPDRLGCDLMYRRGAMPNASVRSSQKK